MLQSFIDFLRFRASKVPLLMSRRPKGGEILPSEVHPLYFNNVFVEIPGDNSCLFHCVVMWWWMIARGHTRRKLSREDSSSLADCLRSHVVLMMENYPKQILSGSGISIEDCIRKEEGVTLEEYTRLMANRSSWGGLIEIEVISLILQLNVAVYQLNPRTGRLEMSMNSVFHDKAPKMSIFLDGWREVESSHFSFLMRNPTDQMETRPINRCLPDVMTPTESILSLTDCCIVFLGDYDDYERGDGLDPYISLSKLYPTLNKYHDIKTIVFIAKDRITLRKFEMETIDKEIQVYENPESGKYELGMIGSEIFQVRTYDEFKNTSSLYSSQDLSILFLNSNYCSIQGTATRLQHNFKGRCYIINHESSPSSSNLLKSINCIGTNGDASFYQVT